MKHVLDVHTHTIVSGHAFSTMREMAKAASQKGLELLGITEHGPNMPGSCGELYFRNLKMVDRNREGVELMLGVELNIMDFDGTVDLRQAILPNLDLVIASLHIPCIKPGTMEENTRAYRNVMKNPYVDIIGHPEDARYPVDFDALVYTAKEEGKLLEVNNNSLDPRCTRQGGHENYLKILELCKEYEQPVIVNSDAHVDQLVGKHEEAYAVFSEVSFPEELVVNRSVAELKRLLKKYK